VPEVDVCRKAGQFLLDPRLRDHERLAATGLDPALQDVSPHSAKVSPGLALEQLVDGQGRSQHLPDRYMRHRHVDPIEHLHGRKPLLEDDLLWECSVHQRSSKKYIRAIVDRHTDLAADGGWRFE
jgi:hypothetical protein